MSRTTAPSAGEERKSEREKERREPFLLLCYFPRCNVSRNTVLISKIIALKNILLTKQQQEFVWHQLVGALLFTDLDGCYIIILYSFF